MRWLSMSVIDVVVVGPHRHHRLEIILAKRVVKSGFGFLRIRVERFFHGRRQRITVNLFYQIHIVSDISPV